MYITDRFDQHDYMFLRELNFIKLFRYDLTTKDSSGRRTTFIIKRCNLSDHPEAMYAFSEMTFLNYFWCKGFGGNHHDNVHDWINLQRRNA